MSTNGRVDGLGRAFAGSQLNLQIYVNRRQSEFDIAILAATPDLNRLSPSITWVSPLEAGRFQEYRDAEFMERVGMGDKYSELKIFWPRRGPVWDALATVRVGSGNTT